MCKGNRENGELRRALHARQQSPGNSSEGRVWGTFLPPALRTLAFTKTSAVSTAGGPVLVLEHSDSHIKPVPSIQLSED